MNINFHFKTMKHKHYYIPVEWIGMAVHSKYNTSYNENFGNWHDFDDWISCINKPAVLFKTYTTGITP